MNRDEKIGVFSQLFRDLEAEVGTRDMAMLLFDALVDAIQAFSAKNSHEFCEQFIQLTEIVRGTEPKFGIVNYNFSKLSKEFGQCVDNSKFSEKKWKREAIKRVTSIFKEASQQKGLLLKYAEKIDVEGKTILIHDHSHTVQDVLKHFKSIGKHFKVIIAEQDYEKTHGNIERLHAAGIPFQVIPSYMLSHIHSKIDMAFFGAVTLKDTMHFVMDPGTHSIVSEFHVEKVPIYMFIETTKFSYWRSKVRGEVFIRHDIRKHHSMQIEYERVKYSHDRVPLNLFTSVVTNKGMFSPTKLKEFFIKKIDIYAGVK